MRPRRRGGPRGGRPAAMIRVWTMMGLGGVRPDDDPLGKIITMFDDAGYIGVVATNYVGRPTTGTCGPVGVSVAMGIDRCRRPSEHRTG